MEKSNVNNEKGRGGFKVPENYFVDLGKSITSQVDSYEKEKSFFNKKISFQIAASVLILISMGAFYNYFLNDSNVQLSANELAYLSTTDLVGYSEDELIEMVFEENLSFGFETDELESDEYIDLIINEGVQDEDILYYSNN